MRCWCMGRVDDRGMFTFTDYHDAHEDREDREVRQSCFFVVIAVFANIAIARGGTRA